MSIKQLTGLGLYEVAYDVTLKGLHTVHVRLDGVDVTGSPFVFTVTTGAPVGSKSASFAHDRPMVMRATLSRWRRSTHMAIPSTSVAQVLGHVRLAPASRHARSSTTKTVHIR